MAEITDNNTVQKNKPLPGRVELAPTTSRATLFYEPDPTFREFYGRLNAGTPGLKMLATLDELSENLDPSKIHSEHDAPKGVIFVWNPRASELYSKISGLFRVMRRINNSLQLGQGIELNVITTDPKSFITRYKEVLPEIDPEKMPTGEPSNFKVTVITKKI